MAAMILSGRVFTFIAALLTLGGLTLPPAPAFAQVEPGGGFQGYLQLLAARARSEGVSEGTIERVIPGLTYNPRVIALDRAQPGSSTTTGAPDFEPYRRSHVDAERIGRGRAIYASVAGWASRIERRWGVPVPILVAIWGHETNYGSYTGDFDLARSLATLAYDGRRRELFADEFVALLKIIDQGVPRSRLVGSWAGAFGNPQFLPSAYLRYAQDFDGDGVRDIWSSRADTLASVAAYFHEAGWRAGEPWGVPAAVPAGLNRQALATRLDAPDCPRVYARHSTWKTVREWRALGVTPLGTIADGTLASLIEPDGPGRTAYLLTGNYRVILQYNCSNYYALSVGLLADAVAR